MTMIIKAIQKQGTCGSILLAPPFVKHLFCVTAVLVLLFIFTWRVLEGEHSSALTNKVILREFKQAARPSQKTNFKEMQRKAVIIENGERKEEGVSEGWVWGSRDVLSGKGWPTAPAQPFRLGFKMPQMWLHNKLLSLLVNAACSMCLCITLSCVLRAWKIQVGGLECRPQVWCPGMGSSTYGRDGRKSSSPVFQLVARIPWRPSIARQTGEKCFHMPITCKQQQ